MSESSYLQKLSNTDAICSGLHQRMGGKDAVQEVMLMLAAVSRQKPVLGTTKGQIVVCQTPVHMIR